MGARLSFELRRLRLLSYGLLLAIVGSVVRTFLGADRASGNFESLLLDGRHLVLRADRRGAFILERIDSLQ